MNTMKAPFPYCGGKSRVADMIWERFGEPDHYIEPFFGSGAVLLGRNIAGHFETVNDIDGLLCNFWRAVKASPRELAKAAVWPPSELDLIARQNALVSQRGSLTESLKSDPNYYDLTAAAWWIYGTCAWIGARFCQSIIRIKKPRMCSGNGIFPAIMRDDLELWFSALSTRLQNVRIACGEWDRLLVPRILGTGREVGILFDPPYDETLCASKPIYGVKSPSVAVREWCLSNGGDARLKIALCGYEGEGHEVLVEHGWTEIKWRANGGYASLGDGPGRANVTKERIWFSPRCHPDGYSATSALFDA